MSAVEDIRQGANQSLNLDDISTLIKNARASTRPGTIHSCQLCNVQELDPLLYVDADDHIVLEPRCVVKYRGTTVLEGVPKGCDLFQELITQLESTLQQRGYGDGSGCVLEFRPQKWICKLRFHSRLQWALIEWESVAGELPAMSLPAADWQAGRTYSFVADKGTYLATSTPRRRDFFNVPNKQPLADDPASKTVRARPFSYERISSQEMAWAKNLLRVCETDHTACSKPDRSFVPSRLLRLQPGSDSQIFVILETDPAAKWHGATGGLEYLALSYCWGGAQELQLNAKSEEDLTRGIHVSSLPLTLRDAVLVAWDLGLHFVWIDCLCIRQDNLNDLSFEIAQIPEIYENSRITISAARASHSREGFLHQSSLPPRSRAAFRLPFACPDGNLGSVILFDAQSNLSPIGRRAWTLQEYLLSRRVLQFTDFRLHWTCRQTALLCRDEPDSLPAIYTGAVSRIHRMYSGFYNTDIHAETG